MTQARLPEWSLRQDHRGKWSLRVGIDRSFAGRWHERSTWVFDAPGRRSAEAKAKKLVAEYQYAVRSRRPPTVEELFEEFLSFSATRGRAPTTLREYRRVWSGFFLPSLGKIPIESLTPFDLDVLYTEAMRRDPPMTPTTIKKYHAVISVALGQAVKWGWIPANPARSVSIPHVPLVHKTLPTRTEVARLIKECTTYDPQLGAFVLLGAITGCRRGELAGLRWSDIHDHQILVRRSIYVMDGAVHVRTTKNGRERSVGVGPQLKKLLGDWRRADASVARRHGGQLESESYLFSDDPLGSHPLNVNLVSAAFRKVVDSMDPPLPPVTLHTLRHFAATQLLVAGANIRDVADRLGHADAFFTLNQYVHSTTDRQSLAGKLAESVVI